MILAYFYLLATDPSSLWRATPRQAPHRLTLTFWPVDSDRPKNVNRFTITLIWLLFLAALLVFISNIPMFIFILNVCVCLCEACRGDLSRRSFNEVGSLARSRVRG
jgi:hypothetical protein